MPVQAIFSMGRTTENMQNMLPIFAIQPVWGPCCYPPLVGPYVEELGDEAPEIVFPDNDLTQCSQTWWRGLFPEPSSESPRLGQLSARSHFGASSSSQPPPTPGLPLTRLPPTEDFLAEDPPTPTEDEPPPKADDQDPPTPTEDEPPPTEEEDQEVPRPPRLPISLKHELGDRRFHKSVRKGRAHVCDSCHKLVKWQSQAFPFDGQWAAGLPTEGDPSQYEAMWDQGLHDFTWICTYCLFENSYFNDLDAFRIHIGIDHVGQRQQRTAQGQIIGKRRHGEVFRDHPA